MVVDLFATLDLSQSDCMIAEVVLSAVSHSVSAA